MSYPPPPWRLYGWAGLLINLKDIRKIRRELLPLPFQTHPTYGTRTLTGHYLGSYTAVHDSSFDRPFHEFGYIPSEASYNGTVGNFVSGMAADHPGAFEGGQQIWGVRKSQGVFQQISDYGYAIQAHKDRIDCRLEFRKQVSLGYWERTFSFLSMRGEKVLRFTMSYHGEVFLCRHKAHRIDTVGWSIPLLFDRCWITMSAPEAIGTEEPSLL